MFLRFVVSVKSGHGHARRGLFRVIGRLRAARADELLAWFNRRLTVPGDDAFNVDGSLCWFKPGASRHIERSRELLALFRAEGWRALEVWNRDPGIVTYEDEAQIVARPRHGSGSTAY